MEREQAIKYMRDLLTLMVEKKGSDLFITRDFPPAIKIDGKVTPVSKTKLTQDNTKALAYAIMNDVLFGAGLLRAHRSRRVDDAAPLARVDRVAAAVRGGRR